jgi:hypothetical protein
VARDLDATIHDAAGEGARAPARQKAAGP